jgi:glycosyltransferase involved in cell wall biosynthesis
MRVICWTELFWPYIGGVEVITARLLPALKERGHELCVVTSHGSLDLPDEDEYEGTPVHRFPFQTALARRNVGEFAATAERLAALKRSFRPDLVHVRFSDPSVLFHLHTRRAHRAPMLLSLHLALPDDIGGHPDTLFVRSFRAAGWITTPSRDILQHLRGLLPEITPRSSVLYNGL